MGPQNVLIGDSTGVELPQMEASEDLLVEEKKMAKYSRSAEFRRIQDHFNERIAFYQSKLPDGRDIGVGKLPTPEEWVVANAIIAEFNLVINMYERAAEAVKEANV